MARERRTSGAAHLRARGHHRERKGWRTTGGGQVDGNNQKHAAAMIAAIGMVRIQAHTIRPATAQRTDDRRRAAPTPTMAPVIVCVVLTGTPRDEARRIVIAPPVSAQKP